MDSLFLELPEREVKPRRRGLTMTIDNGIAHGAFADAITAAPYIDMVKFGWGTALVTPGIDRKSRSCGPRHRLLLRRHPVREVRRQDRFESFLTCAACAMPFVEVSNGTIPCPTRTRPPTSASAPKSSSC